MQITKLFKGAMVVLPLFIATACTSTSQTKNTSSDVNVSDSQKIQQLQSVNAIYFDLDQYNIKPEFARSLDYHAEFLRSHPSFSIVIEGHADERGTPEYNIALGERRASAVKAYLQGHGVTESQMSIVSYGKEKPAVLGHDELAYAKNRRAVIVY